MVLLFILPALVLYLVYSYIVSINEERKFKKFREEKGCEAPHQIVNKLPWGLERVYYILRAPLKGLDVFDDVIAVYQAASGYTNEATGIFGQRAIGTSDPKNLQAVLATKFNDFEQGEVRHNVFGIVLGKSIFNSDGVFWEHSRALFRPQFNRERINDLQETEYSTQALFQALPIQDDGWTGEVDILPLFFRYTLDTVTAFLFGRNLDSLKGAILGTGAHAHIEPELIAEAATNSKMSFADALNTIQGWLSIRIKLQGLYFLGDSREFRKAISYVRHFVGYYTQIAVGERRPDAEKGLANGKKYNLLQALAEETKDQIVLRDQILSEASSSLRSLLATDG